MTFPAVIHDRLLRLLSVRHPIYLTTHLAAKKERRLLTASVPLQGCELLLLQTLGQDLDSTVGHMTN